MGREKERERRRYRTRERWRLWVMCLLARNFSKVSFRVRRFSVTEAVACTNCGRASGERIVCCGFFPPKAGS